MDQTHLLPKRPHSTALDMAENIRCHHAIRVDAEHTLEDALHPNYLWGFHERLRKGDLVEISHELHHFWGLFYVRGADPETASILLTPLYGPTDLKKAPIRKADLSGAQVKLKGILKWCVVAADGTTLAQEIPTRAEAEEWLAARCAGGEAAPVSQ
jgi:hypothetical protein